MFIYEDCIYPNDKPGDGEKIPMGKKSNFAYPGDFIFYFYRHDADL